MVEIYFWLNAVLYIAFSIWCLVKPTDTAAFSGLSFLNVSGRAEYFALYVGLQAAMAIMYIVCALEESLQFAGIFYSVVFYSGAVAGRWISIFQKGSSSKNTYIIAALEIILAGGAILLYCKY